MSSSLFDLAGRVALITGATRGIGFAIAREMARSGAAVMISSDEPAACEAASAQLRSEGFDVRGAPCNVASRKELADLVTRTVQYYRKIDILVCNAGVAPHMGPIASASDAEWDATMTVNLRSVLWLTELVIPAMAERREGSVIIMSSIAGLRGNKALGLYSLSKAANAALVRNLAVEWGPSNVRINAISPGLIQTGFARPLLDNDELLQRRIVLTPLRRVGRPEEIAGIATMLASAAGSYMTGQNIVVDGGTTISDGN